MVFVLCSIYRKWISLSRNAGTAQNRQLLSADAYNAMVLKEKGIKEIYSYDSHHDRIDWLTRLEP